MNTKILVSLLVIGLAAIAISGAMTGAFFSDTETSTGNTFAAGEIDLTVDSNCSWNGVKCVCDNAGACKWEYTDDLCDCTWEAKDLEGNPIINFADIKPGDEGESTISLHVTSNPAWVCAKISNLTNADNNCTEPEAQEDESCDNPGVGQGELQDVISFDIWRDYDCENDFDGNDTYLVQNASAKDLVWPIADSGTGTAVQPDINYCIAVAWSIPKETGNIIQTDSIKADISFEAIQVRHNDNFVCVPGNNTPFCGNGALEAGEECDDGNTDNGDGCSSACTTEISCKADVIAVLDKSGSIDSTELATMKNASHVFVAALDPKTDGVHMGQVSFSNIGTIDLDLTDNRTDIDNAIDAISTGGSTNLTDALLKANQELADVLHDRDDATSSDYMVVITDGEPNDRTSAELQANAADAAGTKIYVVGVGVSTESANWLNNSIATDENHYFAAADFGELETILQGLANCN